MNSKVSVVATPTVVRVNVTTRAADASPEGTTVLSTGETLGTKYLREDGDGTSSWQLVTGASATSVRVSGKVNEAAGITAGQVVYLSGATGGFPQVSVADNTNFATAETLAVATEAASDNQTIIVTIIGLLENIDTSAFTEGQILYLGAAGAMTATHPTGINAVQRVGHAVKINASTGSMIVELDPLTIINDHDGIMRHQIVNQNAGTSASSAYTLVNDADHRSSLSMVGSNYTVIAGIAESLVIYNEGYNKTVNAVDGNFGFEWWTDTGDSHNLSSTSKMDLTAAGELNTLCQTIAHTATEPDDHALEIDCDASGFGDVPASTLCVSRRRQGTTGLSRSSRQPF